MCFDIGIATSGPNEAIIISGVGHGGKPTVIVGGRAVIVPCVQTIQRLPLSILTLIVESPRVYTSQGVPISVTGVAQVKINGANEDMVRAAAEQFGSKDLDEIKGVALATLEGHQRAIMGQMSVEQIYRDRKTFSTKVFEVASSDLYHMGIMVVSYTIKEIKDEVGYLKALGMGRTAEVQRDARIGEAEAHMQTGVAEAYAEELRMESKLFNDTGIAHSKRDYDCKKAGYDIEVNTARAAADLAFDLQAAMTKQKIEEHEQQVKVIERMQLIEIEEQEILRREKELESKVRAPAEAEKFRLEKIAEAHRLRTVLEAEATAEAIAMKGEAMAYAIEAKAKAEAEQMAKKADAWQEYGEAAIVDMFLQKLPLIAREIGQPLAKTKKITMIADGSGNVGAVQLADEIMSIMAKVPEAVNNMTGVDIRKTMMKRS